MPRIAFLDFEASGLDPESYPIEVGFALASGGAPQARLIIPHGDWTHWDPVAQSLHGISRQRLFFEGFDGPDVVNWLRQNLEGHQVYSDALDDQLWLDRLLVAVGSDWRLDLYDAAGLIESAAMRHRHDLNRLRQQVRQKYPIRHRAAPDAGFLRDLYRTASRKPR